ncbi:hypothetical protein RN001_009641 [Aquatica leii]|uniref:Transmembrane protein 177 n=1 Tax=Aquatica leii TaxID=1421715 RepID=A0AAN7NZU9_9COLE|nr:hypothetical protein RN001_009641 [Aquatica leii]
MSFHRFGSWLLKESGKKFMYGVAAATSVTIGCLHIVPNTFLLDKYKDVVHLYKNGFTVPVPRPLLERFNKAIDLLEIKEQDRKQFKPFMVFGFDIFSAGTFFSHYGVIIGLPDNFTYIDSDYIDKTKIQLLESSIPWESDEGILLLKSLAMSDIGQIYAIAREVHMRQSPKYFIDFLSSVSLFILAYGAGTHCNARYNLYAKPRFVRIVLYGMLGLFAYLNYIFVKDASQLYYERKTDEYLINKSPVFKEGGKEFYENILNRNRALRTLMGKLGEHNYSPMGNENYFIRQRHLPLVQRKAFFEDVHTSQDLM